MGPVHGGGGTFTLMQGHKDTPSETSENAKNSPKSQDETHLDVTPHK